MSWLSKLFNCVPKEERNGIHLDFRIAHWKLTSPKGFPAFLRALVDLVPEGAVFYLEGGSPLEELENFLKEESVSEISHLEMGTIWPRPKTFHVPATSEVLFRLADIAEHCAEPEVAIHFHVYKDDRVLLQWFDAFSIPIYVSKEIAEEKVRHFCNKLGIEYQTNTEK